LRGRRSVDDPHFTLAPRRVSLTFVMTGLPVSLLGLSLLFSFKSLPSLAASAEPYRRLLPGDKTHW